MWQDPPEPPKPKKKKTKTQLDDEGNEVVIELSEDESSDEEEQVNHPHDCMPTTPPSKLTYSVFRSPFSAVFCVPVLCPRDPGAAPPSHHPEHPALLRGGGRQPGDVDSEAYATKDDSRWGFLITGGAEFHMPLTVFQVSWGYGYWLWL